MMKIQIALRRIILTLAGSKTKEPRQLCLSLQIHTKHDLRLPPVFHTSYARLSTSPIMSKCLLRVLCPVRRSVTTLDCTLLEESSLTLATGLGPEISSGSCLRVPVRAKWSLDGHFVEVSR